MSGLTRRDAMKIFGATLAALIVNPDVYAGILGGDSISFDSTNKPGLIFIVGDGMPISTLTALQRLRELAGSKTTFYEKFTDRNSVVTYMGTKSLSSIVTDSAPASAAWATGVRTANHFLSILPNGKVLKTASEIAKENDIAIGFVTTTRVTHATPAAWYSHNPDRDDEANIARDALIIKPTVLMGGGLKYFDPFINPKLKQNTLSDFQKAGYQFCKTKEELSNVDYSKPILGLFTKSHIDYYIDRLNNDSMRHEPTLAQMTAVALKRLQQEPKGFLLQIEAGRIDHANHANDAYGALMETAELDQVLDVVDAYIKKNPNTLVVITSDHGTGGFNTYGTGPEYNDSTEAFMKYRQIKASIPFIASKIDGKSPSEVQSIVEEYTGFKITPDEAQLVLESRNPDFNGITGNYLYKAYDSCALGAVLARCQYALSKDGDQTGKPILRRGNIHFVSTTHTGEDQVVVAYGYRAKELVPTYRIDNIDLNKTILSYFNIPYHKNPTMSESDAKKILTAYYEKYTYKDFLESSKLHVS